jgi:hypothetical protein
MKKNIIQQNIIQQNIKKCSKKKCSKKKSKRKSLSGGNILDSIGSIVSTKKNYTTPLSSISKVLNPASIERFTQSSSQQFQIIYNYNTPKPLNININQNKPIPNSLVEFEPHIIIGNMNRYLIVLVDAEPYNRLLWAVEFAFNSKRKTILSYQSPTASLNITGKHNYSINIYSYPNEIQPFSVMDISGRKRKEEYTNLMTYLTNPQTKDKITLIRNFPLNIYKDTSSGVSLFNIVGKQTKQIMSTPKPKPIPTSTIPQQQSLAKLVTRGAQ